MAMLAATSTSVFSQAMRGMVRWHQPTPACMRIEYAVRNSENSEVTTAMNSHRPMRAGVKLMAPMSPPCSRLSQGLAVSRLATANQTATPTRSATTIAVLLNGGPCLRRGRCRWRARIDRHVCGMKSSGAPGTL